jgi:hypothetical protein
LVAVGRSLQCWKLHVRDSWIKKKWNITNKKKKLCQC